jgi:DNA invertase Pin-like site-specific DNA recombinase
LRVSTREQSESKLGLDAQRQAIEATAAKVGLPLAGVFVDAGVSGRARLEQRPGLADALNALRRGDVLIVAKRDRLARDAFVAVLIEREVAKKGGRILSSGGEGTESDEPSAIFTRRILDAVAELERSMIAARTRAALAQKRLRGERVGSVPLGCGLAPDGRTLVPNPAEQAVLHVLYELHDAGSNLRAVAAELNSRGFRTRKGGVWYASYVWLQLRRRITKV